MKNKKISIDEAISTAQEKDGLKGIENISYQETKEKRTVVIQSLLRPSEKKALLSLIGRETGSNDVRALILEFIKKDSKKFRHTIKKSFLWS